MTQPFAPTPRLALALSTLACLVLTLTSAALGAAKDDEREAALAGPYHGLAYRPIGPAAGGRVSRVAGVPGDPNLAFAATAAGGVWRTRNGGREWKPVFDQQPVSSIGSIAIAPSDPNVVWVGSGEANIRGNVGEGNGIYRSTDGGDSWTRVWSAEAQIGTMAVDPRDPDTAFAAVLGSPFGPSEERGVYRTTNGGASWTRTLFVDRDSGASDVVIDPANPRILFAGTWQARRTPWSLASGGPGSGLFKSTDGGDAWTRLEGDGLPEGPWGKVGVRTAPSDPRRVYALIEAEEGGLFRSDDGGSSWERVNPSRGLRQRAWYYSTLTVDPQNADVVWFPQVSLLKTIDGGKSLLPVPGGGWDYHDLWIDPLDPRRILVGSDGGVSFSRDGGESWERAALAISQLYHLAVDSRAPYRVLASIQDMGTASGPSRSLRGDGILPADWHSVGGGEAGWVAPDPSDPRVVWAGEYLGFLSRYDERTGIAPHVGADPDNASGRPPSELAYRFQWTAPIVVSRHDPKVVYHAANVLLRTSDAGQTWTAISPDLTRDDAAKQAWTGGPITGDITGVETYDTIFAVAESPFEASSIWAGSDDGLVHLTRDGGAHWANVTPSDLPPWATVATIEPSPFEPATAYLVAEAHRLDDERPFLWKTTDWGATWKRLGKGLDPEVYLHVVRADPRRPGLLYLGSERGVLVSHDDGATFQSLRLDMPTVAVADLVVAGDDLVVGTIGRSIWILDDLTAVRAAPLEKGEGGPRLFAPPAATRWTIPGTWDALVDPPAAIAANPPLASFTYFLPEKPKGPVTLEVLDAQGRLVRRLSSETKPPYTAPDHPDADPGAKAEPELSAEPGYRRASWDLAYEPARWVPGSRIDTGGPGPGPKVVPGDYSVRLTVDGQVLTETLRVAADPRATGRPEDLEAQVAFSLELRDRMSAIVDRVATIRSLRDQLSALLARDDAGELRAEGERIVAGLTAVEEALHNPHAEVGYDILAGRDGGAKLYSRLAWLAEGALPHPGPPTQGMTRVAGELARETATLEATLERLLTVDLPALEARADALGLARLGIPRR